MSPVMKKIIKMKLKAKAVLDKIQDQVEAAVKSIQYDPKDMNVNKICVAFNKPSKAETDLTAHFFLPAAKWNKEKAEILDRHGEHLNFEDSPMIEVRFTARNGDGAGTLKTLFNMIIPEDEQDEDSLKEVNSVLHMKAEGAMCTVGICPPKDAREFRNLPNHPMLNTVLQSMQAEQGAVLSMKLGTSPESLLSPDADTIINEVLKGAEISFELSLWKKLGAVFDVIAQQDGIPQKLTMLMMGLSPAILLKINANLEIDVDSEMKQKLEDNPMLEPIRLNAHTLLSSMAQCQSEEELDEAVNNLWDKDRQVYDFLT
jgi:hypothetical protein